MTHRFRSVLTICLALALSSAACASTSKQATEQTAGEQTSGDGATASGAPATTGNGGPATSQRPGSGAGGPATAGNGGGKGGSTGSGGSASARTGKIEIGIVRTGVSNAETYGVSFGETVSEAKVYEALIASTNRAGGLAGREIVPVYADTDTASSSWDADFAAACAKFTQDHEVAAVLGYVFNFDPAFETCLARKGIPHVSTTFNVPDRVELAKYPLLANLSTPRIERRSIAKIDGALKTKTITKASKLGVVIDVCPGTQRAWKEVTEPYIRSKGLTVASVFTVGCPHGSDEAAAEASRAGNLVLQFRGAGVDTVLINAVSEGPPVLIIGFAAEAQNWYPRYVVSSLANAAVLATQLPPEQARNIHGYGWMPMQDVEPRHWPGRTKAQDRCIALAKAGGVELKSATDFSYAFNLCDALFAYERALAARAGNTDGKGIVAEIAGFGTSYESAMTLGGKTRFAPGSLDAPSLARYFAWEGSCSCFTYRPVTFDIR